MNPIFCKTVAVANPLPMLRLGWQHLVTIHSDMRHCGDAPSLGRAHDLCLRIKPDILVLDPTMENGSGFVFMRTLLQSMTGIRLLIFCSHLSGADVEKVFKAGATAVTFHHDTEKSILSALAATAEGRLHMTPCVAEERSRDMALPHDQSSGQAELLLTEREVQIFRLIGHCVPMKQVASEAGISIKTVESHIQRIKTKFGFKCNAELRRRATLYVGV